eukprot:g5408.t1
MATSDAKLSAERLLAVKEEDHPTSLTIRFTAFHLVPAPEGGFDASIDKVDDVFINNILVAHKQQSGLLDCRRLCDSANGECIVSTCWSTRDDAYAARANPKWYSGGQQMLWPYVRFGRFTTHHFQPRVLFAAAAAAAAEEDSESAEPVPVFGPCTRATSLVLRGRAAATAEDVAAMDRIVQAFMDQHAGHQPGLRGAQRLVGIDDSAGEYRLLTHWDSVGTLRSSAGGGRLRSDSNSFDVPAGTRLSGTAGTGGNMPPRKIHGGAAAAQFSALFAALLETSLAPLTEPGTSIETREYQHSQLDQQVARVPAAFFEAGSARAATFQLSCISLGVGIFVMPGVFSTMGLFTGAVLVLGWAAACDFGMQACLRLASWSGASTYEGVLAHAFGEPGRQLALVSLAIACWTAQCSHFQFIGSVFVALQGPGGGFIGTLVGDNAKAQRAVSMLLFGVFALPFCMKRRLGELRHVSLVVVGYCLFVSLVVCIKMFARIGEHGVHNAVAVKTVSGGVFADQVPIAAFGYSIIAELFAVRAEAKDPAALAPSVHRAAAIVASIYCVVGIIGALAFDGKVCPDNLLNCFPDDRVVHWLELGLV